MLVSFTPSLQASCYKEMFYGRINILACTISVFGNQFVPPLVLHTHSGMQLMVLQQLLKYCITFSFTSNIITKEKFCFQHNKMHKL